jgi:hypothetical protein
VTTVLRTLPVSLPDLPELGDHAIQGKATVPAAWLLDLLVRTATGANAVADPATKLAAFPLVMRAATFPRFLPADEVEQCTFEVALDDVVGEDAKASTRATLTSRIALAGGICRTRTHAAVTMGGSMPLPPAPPAEIACDLELRAERAYAELIPFGPHYRNLRGEIRLGHDGGTGWVASPEPVGPEPSRAGCPYLFDSAMHLACLWGQRYAGVVAYPTGYSARMISSPLAYGQRRCVVVPRSLTWRPGEGFQTFPRSGSAGQSPATPTRTWRPGEGFQTLGLTFDLWLTDENHRVCDAIVGLAMAPLAHGPQPPAWIIHPQVPRRAP